MSLLTTLRQRALCRPHLSLPSLSTTRHVTLRPALRPSWPRQPSLHRLASTAAIAARRPPSYPSRINIFRAGTLVTVFTGFLRLSTLLLFTTGFLLAPYYFFSPTHSNLWIPVTILGSGIPLLVVILTTGPVLHAIQIQLPAAARKSKVELQRFAESPLSGETVLWFTFMRFAPWMTTKEVQFGRLRRIHPSLRGGMANLEYVPVHVEPHANTIWFRLVQGFWGRYYVKRDQARDRAQVPGVWDRLWEQIPMAGSPGDPLVRGGQGGERKKTVRMSGRPGVMSGRDEAKRKKEIVPPPPPPPMNGRTERKGM